MISRLIRAAADRAQNILMLKPSIIFGRCMVRPVTVYWMMTTECNFRCDMCGVHKDRVDPEDLVTIEDMKNVIDDISEWGVTQFGISGGEPLLDLPKLFSVLEYANKKGLFTHFVTNGFLLTETVIKRYAAIGGGYITVSIDGLRDIHDELRGKKGSFDKCVAAIETVKRLDPKNVKIKITTVINNKNIQDIVSVASLADKYKIPIFIQPYTRFEKTELTKEEISKDPLWISVDKAGSFNKVMDELAALKNISPHLIINSVEHLRSFGVYYGIADKIQVGPCLVGYTNAAISPSGEVVVCSMFEPVGNIKKDRIRSVWYSDKFEGIRRKMLICKRNCMMGCQIRFKLGELIGLGIDWLLRK